MKIQYAILFLIILSLIINAFSSNKDEKAREAKFRELDIQMSELQSQFDSVSKIIAMRDQKVLDLLTANQKTLSSAVEKLGEADAEAAKDIRVVMQDQQQMITVLNDRLKKK